MGSPQLICRDSEIKRIGMWGLGSLQLICSDSEIKRVGIWGLGVFPNIHFIEERFSMMFCNFAMSYMKITLFLRGHSLTHSLTHSIPSESAELLRSARDMGEKKQESQIN